MIGAVVAHPWRTILLALVITVLAFIPASNFTISTNIEEMFETDDPDMAAMNEIQDKFGGQDLVTVVVDASQSDAETSKAFIDEIVPALEENGRFQEVQYRQDLGFAAGNELLYLPLEQMELFASSGFSEESLESFASVLESEGAGDAYFVSGNGDIYLVNMKLKEAIEASEQRNAIFSDLEALLKDTREGNERYEGLEVGFTGSMMVLDYEGDKMAFRDFYGTAIITLLLILLILYLAYRSISLPLLSILPLIFSVIWTMGVAMLIYDALNLLAVAFAVLLMGIGVDFSIHLLTRFMQEMREHNDVDMSFQHTFVHTGKAVILGALTTAAAFLVLLLADLKALHQMGALVAIGFMLTLAAVFLLLPALVTVRLKVGKFKPREPRINVLGTLGVWIQRYAPALVVLLVLLYVGFGFGASSAYLNENLYDLQPKELESYRQLEKIKESFDYNPDTLVTVARSESELASLVAEFEGVDEVAGVESVLDYLPPDQEEKLALIQEAVESNPGFSSLSMLNVTPIAWSDLLPNMQEGSVSEDGEFLITIVPRGDLYNKDYRESLVAELRAIDPGVTADAIVFSRLMTEITDNIIDVSFYAAIICFAIVYIGLRRWNPLYALLALVPVTFGVLGLLGTYRLFGTELSIVNIILIPLVIGIGIDGGIHIIHRYMEEGPGSVSRVVQLTGKAVFLSMATTCLAFSSFLFSAHPSMRQLAAVPIIGLVFCFIGAVIFLPALLRVIVDRRAPQLEAKEDAGRGTAAEIQGDQVG